MKSFTYFDKEFTENDLYNNIIIDCETDCWNSTKSKNNYGYGVYSFRSKGVKKRIYAHRLSYMIFNGDIPNGMLICHKCDNPSCVNPEHLFKGTHSDNMRDMISKGRRKTDIRNYVSSPIQNFRECIAGGIKFKSLTEAGKYFGVSDNAIRKRIKNNWEGYSFL